MLEHLSKRVNTKEGGDRKDTVGISALVDHEATTANLRLKARPDGVEYRKNVKKRHTLMSIIAGSIRAADRLHAAEMIESELCTCTDCEGARATTKHVLWN